MAAAKFVNILGYQSPSVIVKDSLHSQLHEEYCSSQEIRGFLINLFLHAINSLQNISMQSPFIYFHLIVHIKLCFTLFFLFALKRSILRKPLQSTNFKRTMHDIKKVTEFTDIATCASDVK